MGRPRKLNNFLTDVVRKEKYVIREIQDVRMTFASPRKAHLVLEVLRPTTRKHIPLFLAVKHLRHRATVRKTPFRVQFVVPNYYQAKTLQHKFRVKNPIDEFVEVVDITWGDYNKTYNVAIKFIDNIEFVCMMHEYNKRNKIQKKRVKNTTRTRGKKKPRKTHKKRR